jgi:hypothetical protein
MAKWGDMSNLGEFLSRLGNLHDCTVTLFEWRPDDRRVTFAIEDLYFNFEGLPEYRGPLSGRIVLEEVQRVDIDLGGIEGPLRVDEFAVVVEESSDASAVSVTFWPTGRIEVAYRRAVLPDLPLP